MEQKTEKYSFEQWKEMAEKGDPYAQYNLGLCYEKGEGVPQNKNEATKWFTKAVDQGYDSIAVRLGMMYADGSTDNPQNYEESFKWYMIAARHGDAQAQNAIGKFYLRGNGVPQDTTEALRWFHKSAAQQYKYAYFNIGNIYYHGQGVPQDLNEAAKWYKLAADKKVMPAWILYKKITGQIK